MNLLNLEAINKIKKDKEVIAVLLFGSFARGEQNKDIDICLILDKKYDAPYMFQKRLDYIKLLSEKYDVQVFQQLPLYIRIRILKDGKTIMCKDEELLYEIAFLTIKEFESFEKAYNMYLDKVKNG